MSIVISGTDGITPLKATNGSAAAPSVTGTDTDTGLFFGTNEVNIATGGTERVKVDSSGNVGIGTSSIDGSLHVKGANTHGSLVLEAGGTTGSTNLIYLQGHNNAGTAIGEIAFDETATNQGAIVFKTNGGTLTERMRINNDGQLRTLAAQTAFMVSSAFSAGTSEYLIGGQYSASSPGTGTNSFRVYTNGNVQNTNNSYGAISDIKLKENIVDAGSQWNDFKAVRFRKYNFKEETGHETFTQLGVIAQELEQVCPGLVDETPDRDDEGNDLGTTTKSVKYSILTKKALVALQEAMERIETLEAKVAALEGGAS